LKKPRVRRSKVVELTIRVNVPKHAKLADVKAAIADNWYGEVYLDLLREAQIGRGSLFPRIVSAKLAGERRNAR
jgi:hypothetical protein